MDQQELDKYTRLWKYIIIYVLVSINTWIWSDYSLLESFGAILCIILIVYDALLFFDWILGGGSHGGA